MAMHRTPKTTAERRSNDDKELSGIVKIRRRWLPTSYDDINPGDTRSWKKHRRTQYKIKAA